MGESGVEFCVSGGAVFLEGVEAVVTSVRAVGRGTIRNGQQPTVPASLQACAESDDFVVGMGQYKEQTRGGKCTLGRSREALEDGLLVELWQTHVPWDAGSGTWEVCLSVGWPATCG